MVNSNLPNDPVFVHPSAQVEEGARLAPGVKVWNFCHVRKGASLGARASLGKDVFVDEGVVIGAGAKVQNGVSIYKGVTVGEYCFVGPNVTFTNDRFPRAGSLNWKIEETIVEAGGSLGAAAVIVCGVRIGAFAMVGAGALVTKDVPPFHLVIGSPAKALHMICACGHSRHPLGSNSSQLISTCCPKNLGPEALLLAQRVLAERDLSLKS